MKASFIGSIANLAPGSTSKRSHGLVAKLEESPFFFFFRRIEKGAHLGFFKKMVGSILVTPMLRVNKIWEEHLFLKNS